MKARRNSTDTDESAQRSGLLETPTRDPEHGPKESSIDSMLRNTFSRKGSKNLLANQQNDASAVNAERKVSETEYVDSRVRSQSHSTGGNRSISQGVKMQRKGSLRSINSTDQAAGEEDAHFNADGKGSWLSLRSLNKNANRFFGRVLTRGTKSAFFLLIIFAFINLFIFSDNDRVVYQHTLKEWYVFYAQIVLVHMTAVTLDELFFFCTDKIFKNHYGAALTIRCLNGPVAAIVTLTVINTFLNFDGSVVSSFPNWPAFFSALFAICILQILKNFWQRRQYASMLETRFAERFTLLEKHIVLLSRLASYTHPHVAESIAQDRHRSASMEAAAPGSPHPYSSQKGQEQGQGQGTSSSTRSPLAYNDVATSTAASPPVVTTAIGSQKDRKIIPKGSMLKSFQIEGVSAEAGQPIRPKPKRFYLPFFKSFERAAGSDEEKSLSSIHSSDYGDERIHCNGDKTAEASGGLDGNKIRSPAVFTSGSDQFNGQIALSTLPQIGDINPARDRHQQHQQKQEHQLGQDGAKIQRGSPRNSKDPPERPGSEPSSRRSWTSYVTGGSRTGKTPPLGGLDEVAAGAGTSTREAAAMDILRRSSVFRNKVLARMQAAEMEKLKVVFQDFVDEAKELDENEEVSFAAILEQHRNFWMRVAALAKERMELITFNGRVVIKQKKQARNFAERLYRHLTRNARVTLDFATVIEPILRDDNILPQTGENLDQTVKLAKGLFVGNRNCLTLDAVTNAVLTVFENQANLTKSISDFTKLRQSLEGVSNAIFWFLMLLVLQSFLQIDLTVVLAPFLTIVFGISFALGAAVSNFLLSIAFVLFVLPFDVGDRVSLVVESGRVVGNISSVHLLYTVVLTNYNEMLQVPNYALFNKSIYILQSSRQAVFEIPISFAMFGRNIPGMARINQFKDRLNHYIMVEEKDRWKGEPFYSLWGIDSSKNTLNYSLWVQSRFAFFQTEQLYGSRRELIEKMYEIQVELGITFISIAQPVEVQALPAAVSSTFSAMDPACKLASPPHPPAPAAIPTTASVTASAGTGLLGTTPSPSPLDATSNHRPFG